jgi:hypothetical protein
MFDRDPGIRLMTPRASQAASSVGVVALLALLLGGAYLKLR